MNTIKVCFEESDVVIVCVTIDPLKSVYNRNVLFF